MQILEKYKDKKVAVLGFEVEGKSTFKFLEKHGITPAIIDIKNEEDFLADNPDAKDFELNLGPDYLDSLTRYDVIFKTPGISPLKPEIELAKEKGVEFTSQIELFFDLCPSKIIGVTGTKGKGTTSTLVTEILKKSGEDVYLGGNIGVPAIDFLDDLKKESIVVLELSSFQLQVLKKSPNIAVVLNITSEHLDYHKNTDEYRESKANIVRFQRENDVAVVNADYDVPMSFANLTKATKYYFSREKEVDGCYVDESDNIIFNLDEKVVLTNFSEIKLRGRHNLENITAAALAAKLAGVDSSVIGEVIQDFKGLEHRLELVGEISGVKYYNDSFSTVPETAIAALDSFVEPIILIAGGSSKNSDYTPLGQKIAVSNVKTLILIGDTADEIESLIPDTFKGEIARGLKTMPEIVKKAFESATKGDIVLLSPACASFGLFKNYKDRGEQFKKAVKKI